MLNNGLENVEEAIVRNYRLERGLWHNGRHSGSLGCRVCPDRETCGGLNVPSAFLNCITDRCCRRPEDCDSVCRNKPLEFAQRVREVRSFDLGNVARAKRLPTMALPFVVPVLYHGNRRAASLDAVAACVPLHLVAGGRSMAKRFATPKALAARFKFKVGTPLVLTGTAPDAHLEAWWGLGESQRGQVIEQLRGLGVELVTTPNFSLFSDQPRWDDLHSIKRIALVHEEFLRGGLRAALHLNARTERDWERWTEYIALRDEVDYVAFEFTTGAGWAERTDWHAAKLEELANAAGRPLHLVLRATRPDVLRRLSEAFRRVTVLDTTAFIKAVKRQRAILSVDGKVKWAPSPTDPKAPIDDLLAHNCSVMATNYADVVAGTSGRECERRDKAA